MPDLPVVPRVIRAWYVLATSDELRTGAAPLRRTLYGTPIALWRGANGTAGAVLDRCPHRGVPLSMGGVAGDNLACGYHGWEFAPNGHVCRIPSLVGACDKQSRRATAYPVREQQGFVWVWGEPSIPPEVEPYAFPWADDAEHVTVRYRLEADACLHAVAENALDVPHTAFLHGGLFRTDKADKNRLTCKLTRSHLTAACEYVGEPRPEGLIGRILSPSGGLVTHFDRFHLPCTIEVEYSIGTENHLVSAAALTPSEDHRTVVWAVVSVKTRFPGWMLKPVVQPIGLRIFNQDAVVLRAQTEEAARTGKQAYVSTDLDVLGPHILRLLTRAANQGLTGSSEPYTSESEMDV